MIINNFRTEISGDTERFSWHGIDRFKNIQYVTNLLCNLHSIPEKQKVNAKKQATQIRQCLIQAGEYFEAAKSVSLATRPLLLYYGTMSLALAEILLKGSGGMSLDAARGKNAHHGLVLKIEGKPNLAPTLQESAAALRAQPMGVGGNRTGTFHLWWQLSRELPLCGTYKQQYDGHAEEGVNLIFGASDKKFDLLPEKGITLLQCFQNAPYMLQELFENDVQHLLVRSKVDMSSNSATSERIYSIIIHKGHRPTIEKCAEKMIFSSYRQEDLRITAAGSGYIVNFNGDINGIIKFVLPNAFQWYKEEVLFCADNQILNEFGIYYVGAYILGNYARYFPDQWIYDIENTTSLALISSHFLENLQRRVPLLAYGELARSCILLSR